MDIFERIYNISPDGGSGLTELAFLVGFVLLIGVALLSKATRTHAVRMFGRRHE